MRHPSTLPPSRPPPNPIQMPDQLPAGPNNRHHPASYALIALGYTMVYGILKFINFAHSEILI